MDLPSPPPPLKKGDKNFFLSFGVGKKEEEGKSCHQNGQYTEMDSKTASIWETFFLGKVFFTAWEDRRWMEVDVDADADAAVDVDVAISAPACQNKPSPLSSFFTLPPSHSAQTKMRINHSPPSSSFFFLLLLFFLLFFSSSSSSSSSFSSSYDSPNNAG